MRKLSLCAAGSLAVVCLIATAVAPMSSRSDEKLTRTFDVAPGQTITLELKSGGSVSLAGWDKPQAEVVYTQGGRGHAHVVEISEQGGGLRITSEAPEHVGQARSLDFEIKLPHKFNVSFESAGGNLKIVGLEGDFTGLTMGGGLTLIDADGTVELKTMGGQIDVSDAELDGRIITMGGTVFLRDVVGDLNAESMGGNVQYENVRGRDGKLHAPGDVSGDNIEQKTVTISTMGGNIELDEAPAGALLSTMGGNIVVTDATGFVKAKTMGGNIDLHVANGWVDATTMAGRIDVAITGGLGGGEQGVKLSSCCGDVELVVPPDLSMNLDLTIAYTRNSSQDFKITSDFDVRTERSESWDYSNGSPRKRLHGTGIMAGGKYPIVIETVNGDIRLLKAK